MKIKRIIPVCVISSFLLAIVAFNAFAASNVLSYGFRGASSERSAIGKSSSSATTIVITPNYTTLKSGSKVGAMVISADPETPYKNTEVTFEWWTDGSLISTRKAKIVLYKGQLGWPQYSASGELLIGFDALTFTANNNHSGNGHWTFKNSNVDDGIYTKFKATMTNWSTN